MNELKPGDQVVIDDFGVRRVCVAEPMPLEAVFPHKRSEWSPTKLYLKDYDGRYFPADMPRWEDRRRDR